MSSEIEVQSDHRVEAYEAPDVVRLGTADGLTAGVGGDNLGDGGSTIN